MEISDFLSLDCVICDTDCHSKKDALDRLAKTIADSDSATSQSEVYDCLLARERLGSTGLGKGIAIPHGRLQQGKKTLAAFLRLQNAVDYDASDKHPVDLLFALIVPEEATDEHLQILAKLAEMFSQDKVVTNLRKAATPEELYSILTE